MRPKPELVTPRCYIVCASHDLSQRNLTTPIFILTCFQLTETSQSLWSYIICAQHDPSQRKFKQSYTNPHRLFAKLHIQFALHSATSRQDILEIFEKLLLNCHRPSEFAAVEELAERGEVNETTIKESQMKETRSAGIQEDHTSDQEDKWQKMHKQLKEESGARTDKFNSALAIK